ncbi:MAG TPA: enoyl-CoA hydratase-related protein [Thermoanaerobaculia bacterium]|nr:enoyl-CoA hydratase-related protein [Thermoanaerobaculia bacterium]
MIRTSTDNGVTTITLDRPEKLNAFSGTMREDLLAALRGAEGNVVAITGAGRAFCAGGDVEYMALLQEANDVDRFRKLLDAGRDVVVQIAAMPKPVIASVNGIAAGAGCNLALACDYRIASDQAKLSESFVRIGLHPDWGGTWLLPRLVGPGRAFELLTTGRMVAADEALAIGMVDRVVAAEELAQETEKLARAIAAAPPAVIADIKRALASARTNDLGAQIDVESGNQLRAFQSDEARQRIMAFLKRS